MKYWAVIPAAGAGKRMARAVPKQYLPLLGRSVLEWALQPFLSDRRCIGIALALAEHDTYWPKIGLRHDKLTVVTGGAERADSVLAGLNSLLDSASRNDWVAVHDAARPCLHPDDLEALLAIADESEAVGGLLATPLSDTLKQANREQRAIGTVPREFLWRAQTPQLFRLGGLHDALQRAVASGQVVTDEAGAMEALGFQPRLIAGRSDNLKITLPEDVALAESVLAARKF